MTNWKDRWTLAKSHHIKWWKHRGMVLFFIIKKAHETVKPSSSDQLERWWVDPQLRCDRAEQEIANTIYLGDAFPVLPIYLGPGSLATFLGAKPTFTPETVWYEPCIDDVLLKEPISLNLIKNKWWNVHSAFLSEAIHRNKGRYFIGMPDLIENLDTLSAMRGGEKLLLDLVARPEWVHSSLKAINEAYFQVFKLLYATICDEDGGNTDVGMGLWGPGKTCKIQCDFSCMISTKMFDKFALPYLMEQADWLDYSVYHLDGTTALQHLDSILSIKYLDAIQWTPQAGKPPTGSSFWYDLYKKIKKNGKSVMALDVKLDEVLPLIDAVGPEGLFISVYADDIRQAERVFNVAQTMQK